MAGWRWTTCWQADVPAGDGWLSPRERAVQDALARERRRDDWRLGRWTAKALLGMDGVEILAAPDGAPEAYVHGAPAGVGISISHRAGRALAVAGPGAVGCDLEIVEPRSGAFVEQFLAPQEQAAVSMLARDCRDAGINLRWCAKEAAAKVRREGLRLDVGAAWAEPHAGAGEWHPLVVRWTREDLATHGWWREEPGWVMAVAGDPPPLRPSA